MDSLAINAALAGADPATVKAIDRAIREGTVFNHPDVSPVAVCVNDPIIRNQIYKKPSGSRFRVVDWKFGAGNPMDTYYWVFGIGCDLKNDRLTIDVTHRRNRPQLYQAPLTKAFGIESLPEQIRLIILKRRLDTVKAEAVQSK